MANFFVDIALKLWAKTAIAPGYLYRYIDTKNFNRKDIWANLLGENKILCNLNDHVQKQIYYLGGYEAVDAHLFFELFDEDSVFFDIGANVGFYSLTSTTKITKGKTYSFEAVPATFEKLNRNIAESRKADIISTFNFGIWDKEETVTFGLPQEDNIGSFSAGESNSELTVEAQMILLDQFVEQKGIERLDFLKMDIEGAELKALVGARKTLERFKPTILIEVCKVTCEMFGYTPNELWEELSRYGYQAFIADVHTNSIRKIDNFSSISQSNVFLSTIDLKEQFKVWNNKSIRRRFASAVSF